jgi:hypothetical protein
MIGVYVAVGVFGAIIIALLVVAVWVGNNKIIVTNYTEKCDYLPEGEVRIVQLSDLHAKSFGKNNKILVKMVGDLSPDIIVFTGDIIHKYRKKDIERATQLVAQISQIAPVYYVSGNHEMRVKHYGELRDKLIKAGANVLDNKVVLSCGIEIAGLNCAHLKNNSIYNLPSDGKHYRVLLAHKPEFLARYARAGYDLVLSGHAHGGQWRLPFTNIGVYSPGQGLFPKLTSGEHICGSTHMIISRGMGNSEFPLRVFNQPEIVVINLTLNDSIAPHISPNQSKK